MRPPPAESNVGKRVEGKEPHELLSGEYCRCWGSEWYGRSPDGTQVANLSGHQITEHEDGTITVSPSILIRGGGEKDWHGWLKRGVWSLCE